MRNLLFILFICLTFSGAAQSVTIEPDTMQLDTMVEGETVTLTFTVKNNSDAPVEIEGVHGHFYKRYDWIGPSWLAPEQEAKISFAFNTIRGRFDHDVFLVTDAGRHGLRLRGVCNFPIIKMKKDGMVEASYYHDGTLKHEYEILGVAYKGPKPSESKYHEYREFYRNGKVRMKAIYQKGRYTAEYFHPNGEMSAGGSFDGTVQSPKRIGVWSYWHPNGQVAAEGIYQKGVKKGIWREWYPDGTERSKGEFKVHTGVRKLTLGDEENNTKGVQSRSRAVGSYPLWYEEYYPNGNRKYDVVFFDKNGFNGLYSAWHENGQMNAQWFRKKDVEEVRRLWCADGTNLIDYNTFKNLDLKAPEISEDCKHTRNLLRDLPKLSNGPLYDSSIQSR